MELYVCVPLDSNMVIHSSPLCFIVDMHRTFPDNVLFQSTAEPSQRVALYNVLLAYGHHNKAVGYCQVEHTDFLVLVLFDFHHLCLS